MKNSKFKNQPFAIAQDKPTTDNLQLAYGFSLIELLVVITLVGIIGIIISQMFIINVRTQGKSEVIKEVKQNGDFVMSVMESMIRNSANVAVSDCNTNTQKLTIINQDGLETTFDCSGSSVASFSGVLQTTPQATPTGSPLTNNKVAISDCTFRIVCPTPPLYPKYVFINFSISYAGSGLTPTPGSYTNLNYQTTVSLRNYQ